MVHKPLIETVVHNPDLITGFTYIIYANVVPKPVLNNTCIILRGRRGRERVNYIKVSERIEITMNTESLDTGIEEKSYCPREPFKTITVTSFIKEMYEIKFQHFIDLVDVKKEIQRQAKETRNEHLPLDLIILAHKNPDAVHSPCRQNHTFLNDEHLFMFVISRVCP